MINNLKYLKEKKKVLASTLCNRFDITLTEFNAIENNEENNILINNKKLIRKICRYFDIEEWELFPRGNKKEEAISSIHLETQHINRVIFIDTSICMESYHFKRNFLKYFGKICIPKTVMEELNKHKDGRNTLKSDKARRAIKNILEYKQFVEHDFGDEVGKNPDDQIYSAVVNYATKYPNAQTFFLSKDKYHNVKKSKLQNIFILTEEEFHNEIEKFETPYDLEQTKLFWKYIENNTVASLERMDLTNVDINGIHSNNYNPLCYSIINRRMDIVKFLIKLDNIDINITGSNPNGYGPLHCAVASNNNNLVKILLKHENIYPSLLSKDDLVNNVTPLMIAAEKNNEEVVDLLIKEGVSVNQQDTNGQTALHKAAIKNNMKIYNILKDFTDPYILDSYYNFASEYLE